jgi:RNA polymerase sigma-70 factor (ECF subfamily)
MGILRPEKEDKAPPGSLAAVSARYDGRTAAEQRRHRLEEMFREHAPRVLDYARYRGATLAEAEDVVSEVFIVLTRRLEDAPSVPGELLPWLFGIARKVLGNQLRSSRRRQALTERSEEAVVWANRSDQDLSAVATRNLIIRQGLSKLREKDREALLLVAWDGLRYDEAARVLGCTPGAIAQRILRTRQLLLEEIGDIRTYRAIEGKDFSDVESGER